MMQKMKTLPLLTALLLPALPHTAVQAAEKTPDAKADKVFDEAMRSRDMHLLTASGMRYETGVGVGQDADKAVKLYCHAAKMGDGDAKYRLGYLYAYGRGVKRDPELAAAWFGEAVKARLRANTDEVIARGGYGSPTIFVDKNDMYFGNDQLPLVEAALKR